MNKVYTYMNGRVEEAERGIVREFPLQLIVNGREIATLIASPHDLRFLVAGFLRLQGFVRSVTDFEMLSVCTDFGVANVQVKGELPERLKPVLTSGCGTGITFNFPVVENVAIPASSAGGLRPEELFAMMDELAARAASYRNHGGIHSAAVGENGSLLLYAEDLGRHNTLDRIAGEALLKNIDLGGKVLITSGRISSEMAAKAMQLGISVIASRTSPTDMAVTICEKAGITVIGYVRGGKFSVYSHPERLLLRQDKRLDRSERVAGALVTARSGAADKLRMDGVTGIILAGGESRRMGSNKALLPYRGGRFIEAIYRQMAENFDEVLVVTNTPDVYNFLSCRKVKDVFPGVGALAGIHAGLSHATNDHIFVVGCDMPYLNTGLIRRLAAMSESGDVVIPESPAGLEPLHAIYGKTCLPHMERAFAVGEKRIISFFERVNVRVVPKEDVANFDPGFVCFSNINTPNDYYALRDGERTEPPVGLKRKG